MRSYWEIEAEETEKQALRGEGSALPSRADVVVIGGGLVGVLTAYRLGERGVPCVLLTDGKIGEGESGRTTGKITLAHGLCYDRLLREHGREEAQLYVSLHKKAQEDYARIIKEKGISCDHRVLSSVLYTEQQEDLLTKEQKAAEHAGLPCFLSNKDISPLKASLSLVYPEQAEFQPLRFLRALADTLTVFEGTRVSAVSGHTVKTNRGDIYGEHIVFASHYPIGRLSGLFFVREVQSRSYTIALSGGPHLDAHYYGIDPDGISLRSHRNALLLCGEEHRTGESAANLKNDSENIYHCLSEKAHALFPETTPITAFSAQDGMTPDGLPYIGRYSLTHPYRYTATGFGKWGMTASMLSSSLLSSLITDGSADGQSLFSPLRWNMSTVRVALRECGHSVKQYARYLSSSPRLSLSQVPRGEARILRIDGKRCGVYRDDEGAVHIVSAVCPHMGCLLTFNSTEKTWDCPCHGSRFSYDGQPLNTPAVSHLKKGKP